jgi:hypothetical protein
MKTGNNRTTERQNNRKAEQQKKEKPKTEWFEYPKLRNSAKQENEKLRSWELLNF